MIYFVCPDPDSFVSGGNIFNQQILNGLSSLNLAVTRINPENLKDITTHSSDMVVMDSIFIPSISMDLINSIEANKMLLIHLLPSMIDSKRDPDRESELLKEFDQILVNSDFTRQYIFDHYKIGNQVGLIQPWIKKVNKKTASPKNRFIVVVNWLPVKQMDVFFEHLASVDLPEDLSIHIYGDHQVDPIYFQHCIKILNQYPLVKHKITIEGVISQDNLYDVYETSACMLDISSFETYGIAIAEALIAGLRILTLGGGNAKQFIGQGWCIGCNSMLDLIQKMIRVHKKEMIIEEQPIINIITEAELFLLQLEKIFIPKA